jgi:hypothetical protein
LTGRPINRIIEEMGQQCWKTLISADYDLGARQARMVWSMVTVKSAFERYESTSKIRSDSAQWSGETVSQPCRYQQYLFQRQYAAAVA